MGKEEKGSVQFGEETQDRGQGHSVGGESGSAFLLTEPCGPGAGISHNLNNFSSKSLKMGMNGTEGTRKQVLPLIAAQWVF